MGFCFGILQVVLALKNKSINFYAGIISVCFYTYVFYDFKLYAESLLNIYYLFASILGLFLWTQKQEQQISKTIQREWIITIGILVSSFIILFLFLNKFTDSNVPYLDAIVSAFAWAGTWLLLKRKIENWILLNISNLIAIPLQFYKGLELTSLLTIIYVVIAMLGYREWKKKLEHKRC